MSKITTTSPVQCDCGWQSQTHRFTARYSPKENCHGDGYYCQCAYEYAPQNFIPNTFNKTVSRVSHRKINRKPLLSLGVSVPNKAKRKFTPRTCSAHAHCGPASILLPTCSTKLGWEEYKSISVGLTPNFCISMIPCVKHG